LLALCVVCVAFGPRVAMADETVFVCQGPSNGPIFLPSLNPSYTETGPCPMRIESVGTRMPQGTTDRFEADAPAGLSITGASIGNLSSGFVNDGSTGQYGGGFYWNGGGGAEIVPGESSYSTPAGLNTSVFGFFMVCGQSSCTQSDASITVETATLTARETTAPTMTASGVWASPGWVRGTWNLLWGGDSPSGVCALTGSISGVSLSPETVSPNQTTWHQCTTGAWPGDTVETAAYPNGPNPLVLNATDAAGLTNSISKSILIDNSPPTVNFSGPSDSPSTAGTQYITATGSAGPSGVYGIDCSVDGSASVWYPAGTARLAVSGLGEHQVSCYAENNAVDPNGVHGTSAPVTFTTKIGTPTIAAVGFDRVVDGLRCRRITQRVRVPEHSVTVKVGGRPVLVRVPARTQRIRLTRCHVRSVRRRITVVETVRRHGHLVRVHRHRVVRILLTPHVVSRSVRRVGYGRSTTVNGWLGTSSGVALGGQPVQILSAPDNGQDDYQPVATVTTAPNGSWSARLGPGPSRLIRASYAGASTTEATESSSATVVVPARIRLLAVTPKRVPWGGTVRLSGRLAGGYVPPGGVLVRLRIGEGSAVTTYGVHPHVGADNGRFATTYTFGAGEPSQYRSFWFQVATLPMGNYPYAAAASNRRDVVVGGAPTVPRRHRRHRRGR
jgi:hypothetical protein